MTTWRKAGNTAAIFGGANGIGYAAAAQFLDDGMKVLIADKDEDALQAAETALKEQHGDGVVAQPCDVAEMEQVQHVRDIAVGAFGTVDCLMNNAGVIMRTGDPWENQDAWKKIMETNYWGIVHGCQAFIPGMLEAGRPGAVINTGSKQGLTNPPGSYGYNIAKAAVRSYTETVAHAFRQREDCQLTAHLLVPGFTYTSMIARFVAEKPAGAWTAEQVVDYMLPRLAAGDFYIICPDNDVSREMDEKRIQWNTDDIILNRPALSRWHPDYEAAFEKFMAD